MVTSRSASPSRDFRKCIVASPDVEPPRGRSVCSAASTRTVHLRYRDYLWADRHRVYCLRIIDHRKGLLLMRSQSQPSPFAEAIARLHAAMGKVANGDVAAIKALYLHDDSATSFYGWGGYEKKSWRCGLPRQAQMAYLCPRSCGDVGVG